MKKIISLIVAGIMFVVGMHYYNIDKDKTIDDFQENTYDISNIPEYRGYSFVVLNNNKPSFDYDNLPNTSYEYYSKLDSLGRTGEVSACLGIDLMPTEERKSIGMIKPSGWNQAKYDNIDGKYLYNRCHLIGYQLTGKNALETNLITCTRQMNTSTMLEYENKIADYIKTTQNHVLYRVTPVYKDDNLLASGVIMEAYSIEDNGEGIEFNVYVYNVQDGISINYKDGSSKIED